VSKKILAWGFALALTVASAEVSEAAAKYVFFFIGDGMGAVQRNAAETYLAGMREFQGETEFREAQLAMNSLPVSGMITTNSLSGVTDSAAAGTALATGRKTKNSAISMNPDLGENFVSMAHLAHDAGMKVGIVTTVFLQDATPAVFYGHAKNRAERYALGIALANSGFDYFGGGGFINPTGRDKKSPSLINVASSKGYRFVDTREGLRAPASGRVIAMHPKNSGGVMPWAIDSRGKEDGGPTLADFVDYGIRLLDGSGGFFMMVEGGKIDLACHANDAASAIQEVIAFDEAIARAIDFARGRPDETLIVVTSDHETGGMTFDASSVDPVGFYRAMSARRGSYAIFERQVSPKRGDGLDEWIATAKKFFGPGVTTSPGVKRAFEYSMTAKKKRPSARPEYKKLYGPYDPFTVECVRAADGSAGITWTTFYHTGKDVPVGAAGAGSEAFFGNYDNTEIFTKITAAMGL
jgi:alkaline phosphatase